MKKIVIIITLIIICGSKAKSQDFHLSMYDSGPLLEKFRKNAYNHAKKFDMNVILPLYENLCKRLVIKNKKKQSSFIIP